MYVSLQFTVVLSRRAVIKWIDVLYKSAGPFYTVSQKTCDCIFYNNFNNKCPIAKIFGIVSSKSMHHRKMVSFPTSPI